MIARFLYQNPRILGLVLCVIAVAGSSAYLLIPRLEDPVLHKRVAVISTVYPGADSRRVESLVTMPLEERLRGLAEIEHIRSTSRTGISNIVIELRDEVVDVETVWSLVRDRLSDIESALPEECLSPDIEIFPLKAFAAIIAVKWLEPGEVNSLLRKAARELKRNISKLTGTESVEVFGDPGEEYVAEIEAPDLFALRLPAAAIAQQIAASNVTQPAGALRGPDSQLLLDLASQPVLNQLESVPLSVGPDGSSVELSEIASVTRQLIDSPADAALVDGEPAIVVGAYVDDHLRVDQWTAALRRVVQEFEGKYDGELKIEIIFSQSEFIAARLASLTNSLLAGAGAVVAVVFLLMGWRSMVVVGATLPLCVLMVLAGMRALQIPLHQMSVTGLIVALGLLIDNAIVIVEDIRTRIFAGADPDQAIVAGIRHLSMPLFGSTLTTALAFMPIATLPGPPGEFVGTIAVSVILAITSSFVLAMTVVPALLAMMSVRIGRGLTGYGISSRSMEQVYRWSLKAVFRFPILGLLIGATLPSIGFWAAWRLPEQFFPPSDRNQIQVEVELPARESAEKTLATAKTALSTIATDDRVRRVHWFLGGSAPTFYYNVVPRRVGTPFYGQAIVELASATDSQQVVRDLQTKLDGAHPECRVLVRQLEQGPPFDAPIEIRILGPNIPELQRLGSQLRLLLSQTRSVIHTRSDCEETIPKLALNFRSRDAVQSGVRRSDIARLTYTTLEGALAGTVWEGGEELPVRVRMASPVTNRLDTLAALAVPSRQQQTSGALRGAPPSAPSLGTITDFELSSVTAAITRIDGERSNEIKAYIKAGVLPSTVLGDFRRRLASSQFRLPPGYRLEFGGESAERSHAVDSLIANATLLFALITLTLVVSFRSFRQAGVILVVGGLAIGLGPLALWCWGFPFGFMAILGTMGLVGVAINDSIVVLAAIRANHRARGGDLDGLSETVSSCTRHVVATTVTTIVGFSPLIAAGGGFWPPLAVTIAGGVSGATVLALYTVPCMHLLLHRGR